jgi:5-methylcytosine-specific restriction enzyme A
MKDDFSSINVPQKFIKGKIYRRSDLHDKYGGSRQSGISPSANYPIIFLFTGKSGTQYGYDDEWENGIFQYTGEGQEGDMEFLRGNLAIKDHVRNGKELHVFEQQEKAMVNYIGQMVCIGSHFKPGLDKNGKNRRVIIFELTPLSELIEPEPTTMEEKNTILNLEQSSLAELRKKAQLDSVSSSTAVERKTQFWKASQAIKLYAKKRAQGICEGCGNSAPFVKTDGSPYLEVHHINKLSDGGPDDPFWVAAICPNCHRRSHFSIDMSEFNNSLKIIVQKRENAISKQS